MKKIKITKEQYNRIAGLLTEGDDGYAKGGLARVDKQFKKAFAGKDVLNVKAVSYTHLTLPTKRIV